MLTDDAFRQLDESTAPAYTDIEVETAPNGETAWEKIRNEEFDLIISDLAMEGMNGIQLLEKTKSIKPDIPFVILTGVGTIEDAVRSMKLGAYDYLTKPFQHDELLLAINKALDYGRLHSEVKKLREKLDSQTTVMPVLPAESKNPPAASQKEKAKPARKGRAVEKFTFTEDQTLWIQRFVSKNYSLKSITGKVSNEVEKMVIKAIIDEVGDNKAEVARRLGISRPALYKKIKDHGIE